MSKNIIFTALYLVGLSHRTTENPTKVLNRGGKASHVTCFAPNFALVKRISLDLKTNPTSQIVTLA